MEAPDKIYQCRFAVGEYNVAYWLTPHPYAENIEYIRKDLLLEWAKEQFVSCDDSVAMKRAYDKLIEKLNTL